MLSACTSDDYAGLSLQASVALDNIAWKPQIAICNKIRVGLGQIDRATSKSKAAQRSPEVPLLLFGAAGH